VEEQLMNLSKHIVPSFMLSICGIFLAASAHAQYKAGIQGTIQDKSGAAVPAGKVSLANQATGIQHEAISGDTGFSRFTELPPSTYTLTVEVTGFKKKEIKKLTVRKPLRLPNRAVRQRDETANSLSIPVLIVLLPDKLALDHDSLH
jgi:hypothetical protein